MKEYDEMDSAEFWVRRNVQIDAEIKQDAETASQSLGYKCKECGIEMFREDDPHYQGYLMCGKCRTRFNELFGF